jgi:hypothetical protein
LQHADVAHLGGRLLNRESNEDAYSQCGTDVTLPSIPYDRASAAVPPMPMTAS